MAINISECEWKRALTSILEQLDESEYKKMLLCSCLDKIPKRAKTEESREEMPQLIIQYFGVDESISAVNEAMDLIPRKDSAVQDLLRPFVDKLRNKPEEENRGKKRKHDSDWKSADEEPKPKTRFKRNNLVSYSDSSDEEQKIAADQLKSSQPDKERKIPPWRKTIKDVLTSGDLGNKAITGKVVQKSALCPYETQQKKKKFFFYLGVSDETSCIKVMVYGADRYQDIQEGSCYSIENVIMEENVMKVTKQSKVAETGPIDIPEELEVEAGMLIYPQKPVCSIAKAKKYADKTVVSVEGTVTEIGPVELINMKNQRRKKDKQEFQLNDGKDSIRITLWGKDTKQLRGISDGDFVRVTNVKTSHYYEIVSLNSTEFTRIFKERKIPTWKKTIKDVLTSGDLGNKVITGKVVQKSALRTYETQQEEKRFFFYLGVSDETSCIKVMVYGKDRYQDIQEGSCYSFRDVIMEENVMKVTKQSKVAETGPIDVPEELEMEAERLIYPQKPVCSIAKAKEYADKTVVSVEGTVTEDFTPKVLTESRNISYRFRCPGPGVFRCTLTGLVFAMAQEAELLYRAVQWDESLLQPAGKIAAGPLFSIQSSDGAVSQLQLPHCETMGAPFPEGVLSVVHITDDGMSILEPLEITDTHVVVNVPHLSSFGLVWDHVMRLLNITQTIRGQVLLFLRPPDICDRILDVFLLQSNIPLNQVATQQGEAEYIRISSDCHLSTGQSYSVHCEPEASTIQPESAQFHTGDGPNFYPTFEVFLPTNHEKVTLIVQDQEGKQVWKRIVRLTGPRKENLQRNLPTGDSFPAEERLRLVRSQFVDRVSEPTLDRLLDELLGCGVINDDEIQSVGKKPKAQKARDVIDMVRRKGAEASSGLISMLCTVDPILSKQLKLS